MTHENDIFSRCLIVEGNLATVNLAKMLEVVHMLPVRTSIATLVVGDMKAFRLGNPGEPEALIGDSTDLDKLKVSFMRSSLPQLPT